MPFIIKVIAYRSTAVMHDRECLNGDATDLEGLHRLNFVEQSRIHMVGDLALNNALQTIRMGIDRDGEVLCKRLHAFHVVDMVVSDKDGLNASRRQVILCQALHNLLRRNAYVNQDAFILLAHIIAIAAATRGKAAKHKGR